MPAGEVQNLSRLNMYFDLHLQIFRKEDPYRKKNPESGFEHPLAAPQPRSGRGKSTPSPRRHRAASLSVILW